MSRLFFLRQASGAFRGLLERDQPAHVLGCAAFVPCTLDAVVEQERYQVRFDWGVPGAHAVGADADVIIWVDAIDAAPPPLQQLPSSCAVVMTGLAGAALTATWVLALQEALQRRTMVAVLAAGAPRGSGLRFAVEDLLAAGAVMDALESRGIDAMSPEAAAVDAAYRTLQLAVRPMLASVVGPGEATAGWTVLRQHSDATPPHV